MPWDTVHPHPRLYYPLWLKCEVSTGTIIGGRSVLPVELAVTPEERRQGLSDRPSLAPGTGMLFVFESDGHRQFWMKTCTFRWTWSG